MECRSVQDERPRVSTSGGQSGGGLEVECGWDVEETREDFTDLKSANDVQARHLHRY